MRLSGRQVEEIAELADGTDVIVNPVIDKPGWVYFRRDDNLEATIDKFGTVLLKNPPVTIVTKSEVLRDSDR